MCVKMKRSHQVILGILLIVGSFSLINPLVTKVNIADTNITPFSSGDAYGDNDFYTQAVDLNYSDILAIGFDESNQIMQSFIDDIDSEDIDWYKIYIPSNTIAFIGTPYGDSVSLIVYQGGLENEIHHIINMSGSIAFDLSSEDANWYYFKFSSSISLSYEFIICIGMNDPYGSNHVEQNATSIDFSIERYNAWSRFEDFYLFNCTGMDYVEFYLDYTEYFDFNYSIYSDSEIEFSIDDHNTYSVYIKVNCTNIDHFYLKIYSNIPYYYTIRGIVPLYSKPNWKISYIRDDGIVGFKTNDLHLLKVPHHFTLNVYRAYQPFNSSLENAELIFSSSYIVDNYLWDISLNLSKDEIFYGFQYIYENDFSTEIQFLNITDHIQWTEGINPLMIEYEVIEEYPQSTLIFYPLYTQIFNQSAYVYLTPLEDPDYSEDDLVKIYSITDRYNEIIQNNMSFDISYPNSIKINESGSYVIHVKYVNSDKNSSSMGKIFTVKVLNFTEQSFQLNYFENWNENAFTENRKYFNLSYSIVKDATAYVFYRSQDVYFDESEIFKTVFVAPNENFESSINILTVENAGSYYYSYRFTNGAEFSNFSNWIYIEQERLNTPILSLDSQSDYNDMSEFYISWNNVPNADFYSLYVSYSLNDDPIYIADFYETNVCLILNQSITEYIYIKAESNIYVSSNFSNPLKITANFTSENSTTDNSVPTGNIGDTENNSNWVYITLGSVGGLGVIIGIIYFIFKKK